MVAPCETVELEPALLTPCRGVTIIGSDGLRRKARCNVAMSTAGEDE